MRATYKVIKICKDLRTKEIVGNIFQLRKEFDNILVAGNQPRFPKTAARLVDCLNQATKNSKYNGTYVLVGQV